MTKSILKKRSEIIKAIRTFLDNASFLEVETPALQFCPGMEVHIKAIETKVCGAFGQDERTLYLHTSPEIGMKKLIAGGFGNIYQICHAYRNEEVSTCHSPEFTMLEFYRVNANYTDVMQDTINLVRACARQVGVDVFKQGDKVCSLFNDWEKMSVADAFLKYANLDVLDFLTQKGEDAFYKIMLDKVEPNLGVKVPTILYDYPASLGALARVKPTDSRFAERFEVYACGLELGNAFSELTDSIEQRARFRADKLKKESLYGYSYPIDEEFLSMLPRMPECSGIAIGVDRLVMLLTDAQSIEQVLFLPV